MLRKASNPKPPKMPGTKPHEWEEEIGDTMVRTCAIGRDAIDFGWRRIRNRLVQRTPFAT